MFRTQLEKGLDGDWQPPMFIEFRERSRTSTDSRFSEHIMMEVEVGRMMQLPKQLIGMADVYYLPKPIIGKAATTYRDVYTEEPGGTNKREIKCVRSSSHLTPPKPQQALCIAFRFRS